MSIIFQCPSVGTGLLIIGTSITTGLFSLIVFSNAGLNSSAALILIPSTPYALAIGFVGNPRNY